MRTIKAVKTLCVLISAAILTAGCMAVDKPEERLADFNGDGSVDSLYWEAVRGCDIVSIAYANGNTGFVALLSPKQQIDKAMAEDRNKDGHMDVGISWYQRGTERGMFTNLKIVYNLGLDGETAQFSDRKPEEIWGDIR